MFANEDRDVDSASGCTRYVSARDRKVAANEAAAKKLGEDIRTRNLGKELIASRIKIECWDSMEVQKKQVSDIDEEVAIVVHHFHRAVC